MEEQNTFVQKYFSKWSPFSCRRVKAIWRRPTGVMSQSYTPYQQVFIFMYMAIDFWVWLVFEFWVVHVMCTFNPFPPGSAPGSRGLPCPSQCRTKVPHLHPCATERSKPSSKPWSKTSKCRFVILYSSGSGLLSPHCRWAPTVPADAPWDASTTAATTDRLHLPCASGGILGEYQYQCHFMPYLFRVGTWILRTRCNITYSLVVGVRTPQLSNPFLERMHVQMTRKAAMSMTMQTTYAGRVIRSWFAWKRTYVQAASRSITILVILHSITNWMLQARYCDEECRSADWARHGEYCVLMQQKIRKKREAKKLREDLNALKIWYCSLGKVYKNPFFRTLSQTSDPALPLRTFRTH